MFLLLIVQTVSAGRPVDIIFTGDTGIEVEVNIMPAYSLGEARWSIIHLFNVSSGYQYNNTNNPGIHCHVHFRDSQGFELLNLEAVPHQNHWDFNGSAGVNTPLGQYAWTVTCQDEDSMTGGFASGYFEITENGRYIGESGIVWLPVILCYLCMIAFFGWITILLKSEKFKELKGLFFLLFVTNSFLLVIFPLIMSLNVNNPSSLKLIAIAYLSINSLLTVLFIWFYGVHLIKTMLNTIRENKEKVENGD